MYVLYFSVQPQHGAGSSQTGRASFWYGPVRRIEPSCLDCVSEHLCVCPLCFFLRVCFEFFDLGLSPPTPPPPPPPPPPCPVTKLGANHHVCLCCHVSGFVQTAVFIIFWTAQPSVVKLVMVVDHHGPECHAPQKEGLLSSRSKSQWGLIQLVYGCFRYIFWTNDFFASDLSVVVDHPQPKCPKKILDCPVQGQGDSESSEFQLFVWTVSSEPLKLWWPNLFTLVVAHPYSHPLFLLVYPYLFLFFCFLFLVVFFAWHSGLPWCTTLLSLVTKGWVVHEISSGQSWTHGQTGLPPPPLSVLVYPYPFFFFSFFLTF